MVNIGYRVFWQGKYFISVLTKNVILVHHKCKTMFSRVHKNKSDDLSICTLDVVHIDCVPAYKYLGIWLDEKLSFKKHIHE